VTSTVTRCALVVIALLAGAWLVLGIRSVGLEEDGRAVLARAQGGKASPDEVRRGLSSLRRARRFSADKSPLLDEAFLLSAVGRSREGIDVAERLVAEEPDNIDGWIVVYLGSRELNDPERAAQAMRRVRALNPLAAAALPLRPTQ
jgi:hypothetical protein